MSNQGGSSPNGGSGDPSLIPGSDEDLGYQIDVVTWTVAAASGIVLSLRLWCKWLKHRGLWWDDNLLLVSWVFLLLCSIFGTYNRSLGFGKHIWMVNPANYAAIGLMGNIATTFSVLAAVWAKTSFALTMLRLNQGWKAKTFIWFIIVSMNLAMYTTIILTWLQCIAPNTTNCVPNAPYVAYSIFSGSYSAAMDIILALMPWPLIWGLQMKKKEKLGVAIAMSLGVFAGITAIMKTISLQSMASGDFTFFGSQLVIWGNVEVATTIIAASIPVLRVLFIHVKTSAERYYDSSGRKVAGGNSTIRSKINTNITGNRDRRTAKNGSMSGTATGDDDRSDRSILDAGSPRPGLIIQTNEIKLEYSDRSHTRPDIHRNRSGWYEMDKVNNAV